MITISWTGTETRYDLNNIPEYYKVGVWFVNEEEKGAVEIPCSSNFEPLTSENSIIQSLESAFRWQT